jgi:hypothetical protein
MQLFESVFSSIILFLSRKSQIYGRSGTGNRESTSSRLMYRSDAIYRYEHLDVRSPGLLLLAQACHVQAALLIAFEASFKLVIHWLCRH